MRSTIMTAISVVLFDLLQHKVREISLSKQIYSHIISGLLENGVIRRGHIENNLNNFYNK